MTVFTKATTSQGILGTRAGHVSMEEVPDTSLVYTEHASCASAL